MNYGDNHLYDGSIIKCPYCGDIKDPLIYINNNITDNITDKLVDCKECNKKFTLKIDFIDNELDITYYRTFFIN